MIEYLCENYPHLTENVLDKMSCSSIQNLRRTSSCLKKFINTRKRFIFMYSLRFSLTESYLKEKAEKIVDINPSYEVGSYGKDFQKSLEKNQLTRVFVRDIHVLQHVKTEYNKMILETIQPFKNSVFCKKMFINFADQQEASDVIEIFSPEEVNIDCLLLYSDDFLQLPALQGVSSLSMETYFQSATVDLRKKGDKLRTLEIQSPLSYHGEILNFVEDFVAGKQTLRRLVIYNQMTPYFIEKLTTAFKMNIKQESENVFRLSSAEEESFISVKSEIFFFRSFPNAEKEKLQKFFDMGESVVVGPNDFYEESLLNPDLDESLNSESSTDVSRLSSGFSELSFSE